MPGFLVLGARHLGGALADHFNALGYDVATVSFSAETAAKVQARLPTALTLTADVSVPEQLQRVITEAKQGLGSIDVFVNAVSPRISLRTFGGGHLAEADASTIDPYARMLIPSVFHFLRLGGRTLQEQGSGCLIQITGGSARRAMAGRGPWAAAAFASRALTNAAALELRSQGVHAALLIVDAIIESGKTGELLQGKPPEISTSHADVAHAVEFLVKQSPRGWTHELTMTPSGDRWVP